jgi:phosphoglycolate phosphatase-like HAD superfamily hydrolase
MPTRVLLLFDIDGTLLRDAAEAHAYALRRALHEVHGLGAPDGDPAALPKVPAPGRTDMEIAREIALLCELPAKRFDASRAELMSVCLREYARLVPDDLSDRVVEGMQALLAELAGRAGVILSLVTGNLEGVARVKLDRAGLGSFFPARQGAFGSDSDDRSDLVPIARERAGALGGGAPGAPYPREHTIVIGDTDRDIACAHADGVRCIAVTTGPTGAGRLTGADALATSTADLRQKLLSEVERHRG